MKYTIDLGSNIIKNCEAVLFIEDVEVFRLRERSGDGRFIVDFDIRNEKDEKLAVIAKNNVVYAAPGFHSKNLAQESFVCDAAGKVYGHVREVSFGTLKIEGDFWVSGLHVVVSPSDINIGGNVISGNHMIGMGKAIALKKGSFMLGLS